MLALLPAKAGEDGWKEGLLTSFDPPPTPPSPIPLLLRWWWEDGEKVFSGEAKYGGNASHLVSQPHTFVSLFRKRKWNEQSFLSPLLLSLHFGPRELQMLNKDGACSQVERRREVC